MSDRLPSLRPQEVIRALERAGWVVDRQRGSHVALKKAGVEHLITVAVHRREMARGTLADIVKDAGLTNEEFVAFL